MPFCRLLWKSVAAGALSVTLCGLAWPAGDGIVQEQGSPVGTTSRASKSIHGEFSAVGGQSCNLLVDADSRSLDRAEAVESFLESHSCEITGLARDFVQAAELNKFDYRLLPVLAVLETGCGRAARNNNLFGWANGRKRFSSFRQGIHFVAQRLQFAPHYSGKSVAEKLKIYNRRAAYRRKVLKMMETMPELDGESQLASISAGGVGLE